MAKLERDWKEIFILLWTAWGDISLGRCVKSGEQLGNKLLGEG